MIRRMRPEDIPEAARLEKKYFSVPWTEKMLRESFENTGYLFLTAEKDQKVVGYAGLLCIQDEGDVTNIVVDEAYRGQGIGTMLTRGLLSEGRKLGLCSFTLEVRVSNASAIHIYEKIGFRAEGVRRRFYEKPTEDALIMWIRQEETLPVNQSSSEQ